MARECLILFLGLATLCSYGLGQDSLNCEEFGNEVSDRALRDGSPTYRMIQNMQSMGRSGTIRSVKAFVETMKPFKVGLYTAGAAQFEYTLRTETDFITPTTTGLVEIPLEGANALEVQADDHLGWSWSEGGVIKFDQVSDLDNHLCGGSASMEEGETRTFPHGFGRVYSIAVSFCGPDDEDDEEVPETGVEECKSEIKDIVACEDRGSVDLQCAEGTYIKIQRANYGRTVRDARMCQYGKTHNDRTDCVSENSKDVVKEQCQGKQSCSVTSSNGVFGDPCVGTYKYLQVRYRCISKAKSCRQGCKQFGGDVKDRSLTDLLPLYTMIQKTQTVGYTGTIKSVKAFVQAKLPFKIGLYTAGTEQCGFTLRAETDFITPDRTGLVKILLEGSNILEAQADDHLGWSWKEGGVIKYDQYLNVDDTLCGGSFLMEKDETKTLPHSFARDYSISASSCRVQVKDDDEDDEDLPESSDEKCKGPVIDTITCENRGSVDIQCPADSKIRIKSANYGRTVGDAQMCSWGIPHLNRTDCVDENSFALVREQCHGKQFCSVLASNRVFGDPCFGTYKYLQVQWQCGKKSCGCNRFGVRVRDRAAVDVQPLYTMIKKTTPLEFAGTIKSVVAYVATKKPFKVGLYMAGTEQDKFTLRAQTDFLTPLQTGKIEVQLEGANLLEAQVGDHLGWSWNDGGVIKHDEYIDSVATVCGGSFLMEEGETKTMSDRFARAYSVDARFCNAKDNEDDKVDEIPETGEQGCRGPIMEKITCENRGTVDIQCPAGTKIKINDANYGRTVGDGLMCPYGRPHQNRTDCGSEDHVELVKLQCQNKQSCSVTASNSMFGDPCYGTYKYLQVRYRCVDSEGCCNRFGVEMTDRAVVDLLPLYTMIQKSNALVHAGTIKSVKAFVETKKPFKLGLYTAGTDQCEFTLRAQTDFITPNETGRIRIELDSADYLEAKVGDHLGWSWNEGGVIKYDDYKDSSATLCGGSFLMEEGQTKIMPNSFARDYSVLGSFCRLSDDDDDEGCQSPIMKKVTCENLGTVDIRCTGGTRIRINNANYGRTVSDAQMCPYGKPHKNRRDCGPENGVELVKEQCQGKRSCSVASSNGVFGDPCFGTYKYLEVQYQCVPKDCGCQIPIQEKVTCENRGTVDIQCPEHNKIRIKGANYGRTVGDGEMCPYGRSHLNRTDCGAENSLELVKEQCQGKQSCSVASSNGVFGDPCYGTYKYLQVQYQCVSRDCGCNRFDGKAKNRAVVDLQPLYTMIQHTKPLTYSGTIKKVKAFVETKKPFKLGLYTAGTEQCEFTLRQQTGFITPDQTGKIKIALEGSNKLKAQVGDYLGWSWSEGGVIKYDQHMDSNSTLCGGSFLMKKGERRIMPHSFARTYSIFGTFCCQNDGDDEEDDDVPETGDEVCTSDVQERVACENRGSVEVQCPAGKFIKVDYANYGRTTGDAQMCQYGRPHNDKTDCTSEASQQLVRRECDGQQSCTVSSSNGVFGDPCVGTYKYLQVRYQCLGASCTCNGDMVEKVACENRGSVDFECPAGKWIKIDYANYGRTVGDNEQCSYGRRHNNRTDCVSEASEELVKNQCDGQQSCSVTSSNRVFGDPCRGTYKYLQVRYQCMSSSCFMEDDGTREAIMCENTNTLNIKCPAGKKIEVDHANFGRTVGDDQLCPYTRRHKNRIDCVNPKSQETVKMACNGKESCSLDATTTVFGDPCRGTYKYLEVKYRCT